MTTTTDIEPTIIKTAAGYVIEFDMMVNSEQFGRYKSATLELPKLFAGDMSAFMYGQRVVDYFKQTNKFPNFSAEEWQ